MRYIANERGGLGRDIFALYWATFLPLYTYADFSPQYFTVQNYINI